QRSAGLLRAYGELRFEDERPQCWRRYRAGRNSLAGAGDRRVRCTAGDGSGAVRGAHERLRWGAPPDALPLIMNWEEDGRMIRVLIVDDEDDALDLLEILLTQIGDVEIVGRFADPIQAIEALRASPVDAVFMD